MVMYYTYLFHDQDAAREKREERLHAIVSKAADEVMKVNEHTFIVTESQKAEKYMLEVCRLCDTDHECRRN